jgi:hypothetical protein
MRSNSQVSRMLRHLTTEWRWQVTAVDVTYTARQRTSWQLTAVSSRRPAQIPQQECASSVQRRSMGALSAAAAKTSVSGAEVQVSPNVSTTATASGTYHTVVSGNQTSASLCPLQQVAPEATANDWFRFTARPHEYWDHRATKQASQPCTRHAPCLMSGTPHLDAQWPPAKAEVPPHGRRTPQRRTLRTSTTCSRRCGSAGRPPGRRAWWPRSTAGRTPPTRRAWGYF